MTKRRRGEVSPGRWTAGIAKVLAGAWGQFAPPLARFSGFLDILAFWFWISVLDSWIFEILGEFPFYSDLIG